MENKELNEQLGEGYTDFLDEQSKYANLNYREWYYGNFKVYKMEKHIEAIKIYMETMKIYMETMKTYLEQIEKNTQKNIKKQGVKNDDTN